MRRLFKADAAAQQDEQPRESAGAMLRAAREASGQQVSDVASMLRIRLPYLQAIEDERYGDLPGAAYVSGFLRSYAEHLGLDPEAVARRYKEETAGRDARQELYLPTPAAEGRMPGGTLLFGALLLAGAVYGAWYYVSATDRSIVDLTPALPDRLVALLEGLPWRSGETGPTALAPLASPALPSAAPPAAPPAAAVPPAVSLALVAPPAAPVPTPPPLPVRPGVALNGATSSAAPPAPSPAALSASSATTPPPPAATPPAAVTPAPQGAAAPPPPQAAGFRPPEAEEEIEGSAHEPTPLAPNAGSLSPPAVAHIDLPPLTGKNYGAQNGGARLQLRATQEAWLQVRDKSGEILFNRTLKPGDVYRAPDRPGLKVRTGNAGGLVLITDSVVGPPLGAVGQVLRDVPLDAPSLRGATN